LHFAFCILHFAFCYWIFAYGDVYPGENRHSVDRRTANDVILVCENSSAIFDTKIAAEIMNGENLPVLPVEKSGKTSRTVKVSFNSASPPHDVSEQYKKSLDGISSSNGDNLGRMK
jgi:hypothetical protein